MPVSGSFGNCLAGRSEPVKVDLHQTESHLGNPVGSRTWSRRTSRHGHISHTQVLHELSTACSHDGMVLASTCAAPLRPLRWKVASMIDCRMITAVAALCALPDAVERSRIVPCPGTGCATIRMSLRVAASRNAADAFCRCPREVSPSARSPGRGCRAQLRHSADTACTRCSGTVGDILQYTNTYNSKYASVSFNPSLWSPMDSPCGSTCYGSQTRKHQDSLGLPVSLPAASARLSAAEYAGREALRAATSERMAARGTSQEA